MELREKLIAFMKKNPGKPLVVFQCCECDYKGSYFARDDDLFFDLGCHCINNGFVKREWSELDFFLEPHRIKQFGVLSYIGENHG